MLWNLVFDFYINHIFGGINSTGQLFSAYLFDSTGLGPAYATYTTNFTFDLFGKTLPLGNYLSMIATIITMVIIVTLCALFIWKMVKLVGGLIR